VLVSPYNRFWQHLRNELTLALQRRVPITAIYRDDEPSEDMEWLLGMGATVISVDRLHAKLFLNESYVILTSMNLVETSSKNSREIAIRVDGGPNSVAVRDYVHKQLIPLGRRVELQPLRSKVADARTQPDRSRPNAKGISAPARSGSTGLGGRCIRCKGSIPFDPAKPYCSECYGFWSQTQDRAFIELCCHRCGQNATTSFARPQCEECYSANR